jgi:cytochrome oxidase Cu insertion factor (SCO1/SenC/PrrC family)
MADLRLVSISVDPERDTPVVLSHYAARFQADPERWLFLTGDKGEIHRLAREGFRLGLADASGFSSISPVPGRAAEGLRPAVERPLGSGVGQPTSWPHTLRRWLGSGAPALAFADHGQAKDTLHSTRFVLIDRLGHIRGYYESREQAALERLRQHLQMLFQNG